MIKLNNWLISAWKANVSVSDILSLSEKQKNPETQNLFFKKEKKYPETQNLFFK